MTLDTGSHWRERARVGGREQGGKEEELKVLTEQLFLRLDVSEESDGESRNEAGVGDRQDDKTRGLERLMLDEYGR